MPTPMPSPLPTPSKQRLLQLRNNSTESSNQDYTADDTESEASVTVERSSSDTSGNDARVFFRAFDRNKTDDNRIPIPLVVPKLILNLPSPGTSPGSSPVCSPKVKIRPPPLILNNSYIDNFLEISPPKVPIINVLNETGDVLERFDSTPRQRSQSVDAGCSLTLPSITVSLIDDSQTFQPPQLMVTCASPQVKRKRRTSLAITETVEEVDDEIAISNKQIVNTPAPIRKHHMALCKSNDKPGSLDLQEIPIAISSSLLTIDSDPESPANSRKPKASTSKFLTPFFGTAGLHTSESNLSSSGYSSAYSPGPSRCNSNNPLFSTENDEPLTPTVSSIPSRPACLANIDLTKRSLTSIQTTVHPPNITFSDPSPIPVPSIAVEGKFGQTDSETTDDPPTSQQDSALEIDTNDEPDNEVLNQSFSPKELFSLNEQTNAQRQRILLSSSHSFPEESTKLQRFPPLIVLHSSLRSESSLEEFLGDRPKKLSPVSSRSESPISDSKLSVHRIHPAFFSKAGKLELPYTDSDGLYDCPSSEVLNSDSHNKGTSPQRRHERRKIKRSSMKSKAGHNINGGQRFSGTRGRQVSSAIKSANVAEGGSSETAISGSSRATPETLDPPVHRSPRRISPKRRSRAQNSIDLLSSSNESITSQRSVLIQNVI